MKAKVGVVDYGVGNLHSLENAFHKLKINCEITTSPSSLAKFSHVILPGVGAFGEGIKALHKSGFVPALEDFKKNDQPLLGICLGMQFLFDRSEEFGMHKGLGWIAGDVIKIPEVNSQNQRRKVPHIGWNHLKIKKSSVLLEDCVENPNFYFVHSFYVKPKDSECLEAVCDYEGLELAAIVRKENVWGCQFHPEKSQTQGLKLLENFLKVES